MFFHLAPKFLRLRSKPLANSYSLAAAIALGIGICFWSSSVAAQQNNQPAPPQSTNSAATSSITLDVVVKNPSGQLMPGLQQQDFTLVDNKLPQKVTFFAAEEGGKSSIEAPTQVLLLLDEVNTPIRLMRSARQELQKYLGQQSELPQPTSIVFFSDSGAGATKATRDPKFLLTELEQHPAPLSDHKAAQGLFGAGERFNLSLRTMGQLAEYESDRPGRKLVIWIGSGWPFLSNAGVNLSVENQQSLFGTIVAMSGTLARARITLYNVDPVGSGGLGREYYKAFTKPVTAARQVQAGNLALQVLAYQSGGLVLNSSNDLASEIATCVADASSYYTLTFEAAAGDGPNQYHAVEVKITKADLTARTRVGYYAQPKPSAPH
jgi:VWFA-related protein